jgi:hypothetical protein
MYAIPIGIAIGYVGIVNYSSINKNNMKMIKPWAKAYLTVCRV